MNIDELKNNWKELHDKGLEARNPNDIKNIIGRGTSQIVAEINRKLVNGMVITAVATIISSLTVVFFYFFYDQAQHPWIDTAKLFPIQLLAFIIFLLLFLSGFAEYRLVNKKFTSASVSSFIASVLIGFRRYFWVFTVFILLLLFAVYLMELSYFLAPETQLEFITVIGISLLLTTVSFFVSRQYYRNTFAAYFSDLQSYLDELKS
ncbi:MAG: hypothetical protein AAF632_19310 [Bacteroidota bacterium]